VAYNPDYFKAFFYAQGINFNWDLVRFCINDVSTWMPLLPQLIIRVLGYSLGVLITIILMKIYKNYKNKGEK
jgi:uncharacterized membrane protein SpoIIM required for sporulation